MSGSYWNRRAKRWGHTGWGDLSRYVFDQKMRMMSLSDLLARAELRPGSACLDFGCGTGDAAFLLHNCGMRVIGFDISSEVLKIAQARDKAAEIAFTDDEGRAFGRTYDLVLCITVLQHIVDDEQFIETLRRIYGALSCGGTLLILDTLSIELTSNEYSKIRGMKNVIQYAEQAGFEVREMINFPHPDFNPSLSYKKYSADKVVRAIKTLSWGAPKSVLSFFAWILDGRADRYLTDNVGEAVNAGPMKWLVLAKPGSNG